MIRERVLLLFSVANNQDWTFDLFIYLIQESAESQKKKRKNYRYVHGPQAKLKFEFDNSLLSSKVLSCPLHSVMVLKNHIIDTLHNIVMVLVPHQPLHWELRELFDK